MHHTRAKLVCVQVVIMKFLHYLSEEIICIFLSVFYKDCAAFIVDGRESVELQAAVLDDETTGKGFILTCSAKVTGPGLVLALGVGDDMVSIQRKWDVSTNLLYFLHSMNHSMVIFEKTMNHFKKQIKNQVASVVD